MGIIADIEAKIKANPLYGVQFGIDPECFECNLGEDRCYFGENYTFMNGGTTFNYQPIIIDGEEVGSLEEIVPWHPFGLEPMRTSFILPLDENKLTRREKKSKHFCMGPYENPQLRFATLQQLVDFLKIK